MIDCGHTIRNAAAVGNAIDSKNASNKQAKALEAKTQRAAGAVFSKLGHLTTAATPTGVKSLAEDAPEADKRAILDGIKDAKHSGSPGAQSRARAATDPLGGHDYRRGQGN
ncbi:hypothetical protein COB21_01715 [Candidatus Aerophobetes bacterium]|uniref:Uncharacterized protein n=1 Tax=Aerophobetes bacterium TaxID=2030807 RepID=A0A2A4X7L7_UNCAE|nr:MAG: hypothetical protein COB21_01715 [Candidatus Aerophobetes bacterium]